MLIRTPADFGAAIRERRRQIGLDQATLAKRIGVSRQWVIGIERGRSRAELGLVLRVLDELGIRLDTQSGDTRSTGQSPIDLDAIVRVAREDKR
jgi:HTH-type transcriptional regulator / antitoxin HipB